MNIIGTGLSGLVGSRIVELLSSEYSFENISRQTGVDILDRELLIKKIAGSQTSVVLHFAAKTDVDECEKDRDNDSEILRYKDKKKQEEEWNIKKTAWGINVLGTKNIVNACERAGKKLIYISTDFVFDGGSPPEKGYTEEDVPRPINWYGQTKFEGEKAVQNARIPWTIIRISYPYRATFEKKDFARAMMNRLKNNQPILAITDQFITPTFIDDIAQAVNVIIVKNATGIIHVTGSQFISPYDIAQLIVKEYNFDQSLISPTTRAEFFANRAPRPFKSIVRNDKIKKLGVLMKTFSEGLEVVKQQTL